MVFLHVIPLSLFPCTRKDVRVILERILKDLRRELRGDADSSLCGLFSRPSFCKVWVKLVQFRQILGLDGGCGAGFRLTWHGIWRGQLSCLPFNCKSVLLGFAPDTPHCTNSWNLTCTYLYLCIPIFIRGGIFAQSDGGRNGVLVPLLSPSFTKNLMD